MSWKYHDDCTTLLICSSHRDFPDFLDKVIGDNISLYPNVGDDVFWVILDGVLGIKEGVLAEAPHVEGDGLLVGVGDLTPSAFLEVAAVLVNVLVFLLNSEVSRSTEILPLLTLRPVIPVSVKTGAVIIQQPLSAHIMNQRCPRGEETKETYKILFYEKWHY